MNSRTHDATREALFTAFREATLATYGKRLVADATEAVRSRIWSDQNAEVELSPVFKTPLELATVSPLRGSAQEAESGRESVTAFDRSGDLSLPTARTVPNSIEPVIPTTG